MSDLAFYHNRLRLLLPCLGAWLFVALGAWFMLSPETFAKPDRSATQVFWTGAFIALFFFACAAVFGRYLFSRRPALIIAENGFYDHSSLFAAGFLVEWHEVKGIATTTVKTGRHHTQTMLSVALADESAFSSKLPAWKRALLRLNRKWGYAPVNIVVRGADTEELAACMRRYRRHYSRRNEILIQDGEPQTVQR
ncbi:MAG: STM3941 family protein [Neisseria sp.]|nr:STM3941 family protein [Neisseria sp.]